MEWFLLGLVLVTAASVYAARRVRLPVGEWRALASRRGGVFIDDADQPAIEVDVGDVRVRFELNLGIPAPRSRVTICRARWLVPCGPRFDIEPGTMGAIGKLLGADDVVLGLDPEFDRRHVVKTGDPDAVRRAWSPRAIRLFLALGHANICSDGRTIDLGRDLSDSPAVMDAMIDLVGELAGADLFGTRALRKLPGATYHPPTGPWNARTTPHAVIERPVPVTLMPVVVDERAVTRATVGDGPRAQRIEITVHEDGTIQPADGAALVPPAAAALLDRLGHGTLVIDGADTSFTWRAVERDAERLLAGARLLAILAGGPALGAYR
jgi:hypothetical protein